MVTSGGAEDGKADRYLADFAAVGDAEQWQALVTGRTPQDDPAALVVRHQAEDLIFATVFGQVITASPGSLSLGYSRTPWQAGTWRTERWPQG
jgi:hypothetical protein